MILLAYGHQSCYVEGVEGNEGHVIGNWNNGIIAMQWRVLNKIASCGYVEAETVK